MSKYLCLSQRSTRTISIYAYGIVGGFMSERDRAILYACYHYLAVIIYAAYWRVWGEAASMRQELQERRYDMMTRSTPSGLCTLPETHSPAHTNTDQPTARVIGIDEASGEDETVRIVVNSEVTAKGNHRVWIEAVLDYCEQHGTEAYIRSLGFKGLEPILTSERTMKRIESFTYYRRTMRGKSVRYVECDRLCGEVLYIKKGKRYIAVS